MLDAGDSEKCVNGSSTIAAKRRAEISSEGKSAKLLCLRNSIFSYYLLTILYLIERLISRGGNRLNGVEIDPFLVMPTFSRLETYYRRYPKILVLGYLI